MKPKRVLVVSLLVILILGFLVILIKRGVAPKSVPKVGILQFVTHRALDAIRDNIISELRTQGFSAGTNIAVQVQNAEGQIPVARTMADQFVGSGVSLLIPITTPCAQVAVQAAKGLTPIVFSGVTDPVSTGVVPSLGPSHRNVTGVSDRWPIRQQIDLIVAILPTTKNIGILFNPGEANNDTTLPLIREACQKKGILLVEAPVSTVGEVSSAANALVGRVDALFTSADSTVASGLDALIKVAEHSRIPLFVGDVDNVERGAIATVGISNAEIGKLTGQLAARVLRGENPGDIPVKLVTSFEVVVNLSAARRMGVSIPAEVLRRAAKVIP